MVSRPQWNKTRPITLYFLISYTECRQMFADNNWPKWAHDRHDMVHVRLKLDWSFISAKKIQIIVTTYMKKKQTKMS